MSKEATLYSPVIKDERGIVSVVFAKDHPGYDDPEYQRHRAGIAEAALRYVPGQPVPDVVYTEEEHATWRLVNAELAEKHRRHACREFLAGKERLALPDDRLPQLGEASAAINEATGFRFSPAAGLVEVRDFYGSLADRRFQATQYIRHFSMPRFSPEPDMIHEVVGHGSHLSAQRLADLYELFGKAVRRLRSKEAVGMVSSVFWFAMEYGLVREDGDIKACGASLLSSCAELERFQEADIRPLDVASMAGQGYLVEQYQPVLFCADSFAHMEEFLSTFLITVSDADPLATT
ncbi:phenylalanine 4-monooxygenase [Streptosporangium sp. NPDC049376]|uniref:phenylalanine 4-monooxygenase n=1 Tax=Streptosporangium sp. NPDC049376 TaxID=3366192 RepID=UPI0037B7F4A8